MITTPDNKFRGEHGSPEHKEHIARIALEHDVNDVIESLLALNDAAFPIETRAQAARDLEYFQEEVPAAYSEGLAVYEKAAADAGLVTLRARQRPPFNPAESRVGDVFSKAPPFPPFV